MIFSTQESLESYKPEIKEESIFKKQMLSFLQENGDEHLRSCQQGHFTASALLLNKDMTKALLMHHTKLDRWFQLGGHCDGNSDVLGVAIKEAQEESGIEHIKPVSDGIFDLDIHKIPELKGDPEHLHFDIRFLLEVESDECVVQNRESKELKWFSKSDSIPTDNPSVLRLISKWAKLP
ncbi:MAG: NUDIX hydrolase [Oligoflexales bacterium]|nr:NUDIX hydrolase [Oligoflexales bacterium]